LEIHSGDCGPEFTALSAHVSASYGLCLFRTAEYLNWRYLRNPFLRHTIIAARQDGDLQGYAVIADEPDRSRAMIVDVFGRPDPETIDLLIRGALRVLRNHHVAVASLWLPDEHPWTPFLQGLGFRAREASAVVIHQLGVTVPPSTALNTGQWFLTNGDRDS
jgi:hypothetical protein